jgi:predicted GNAT family N-acyltransferase
VQIIKKPKECSKQELDEFIGLVVEGGQVNNHGIGDRVRDSFLLGFVYSAEMKMIAIAAVKKPSETYKSEVFRKAKTLENPTIYFFELGWIYVSNSFRGQGISRNLCSELLIDIKQSIFATTACDNAPMQRILMNLGFEKSGQPYSGNSRSLDLFIKH